MKGSVICLVVENISVSIDGRAPENIKVRGPCLVLELKWALAQPHS